MTHKRNIKGFELGRQPKQLLTYQGATRGIAEWSRKLAIKRKTIEERLKRGWSVDRALGTDPSTGRWH